MLISISHIEIILPLRQRIFEVIYISLNAPVVSQIENIVTSLYASQYYISASRTIHIMRKCLRVDLERHGMFMALRILDDERECTYFAFSIRNRLRRLYYSGITGRSMMPSVCWHTSISLITIDAGHEFVDLKYITKFYFSAYSSNELTIISTRRV